jgi:molecular chaperone GrpE
MEIPIEVEDSNSEPALEATGTAQPDEQVVDVGPVESEAEPVSKPGRESSEKEIDYLDQLRRLKAEFDNYRKRTEKEKQEFYTFAKGRVIQNLLPVLDDLDRMVRHGKGHGHSLFTGIEMIRQKMKGILVSEGLEEINPEGKVFDPVFHEALGTLDTVPEKDGHVMDELEKGYLLQGRLLRPSRVRVGSSKEGRAS